MGRLFAVVLALLAASAAPSQDSAHQPFAHSKQARGGGRFGMLLRQFRADEPQLPERHEAGSKPATPVYQGARDIPAGHWVWQSPYWFVFRDGPDHAAEQRAWGPEAACRAPDTTAPGDYESAWAAKEQDAKDEWLLLEYATPVRATALEVHETNNPGAIAAVAILTPQGDELELWRNREVGATVERGRILQVDLPLGFEVERVKVYLASESVPGWNAIDAVGLRDDKGKVHWAALAEASSWRADPGAQAGAQVVAVFRQRLAAGAQLQPLQARMPRVVLQAPQLQGVFQPVPPREIAVFGVMPDPAENKQLRQRVAELEAKVKALEAELARAKAGK